MDLRSRTKNVEKTLNINKKRQICSLIEFFKVALEGEKEGVEYELNLELKKFL